MWRCISRMLVAAEHTWGTDTKSYLDDEHYRPANLGRFEEPGYVVTETSWREERQNTLDAVASLPRELQRRAHHAIQRCRAVTPPTASMRPHKPCHAKKDRAVFTAFRSVDWSNFRPAKQIQLALNGHVWIRPLRSSPIRHFRPPTQTHLERYLTVEMDWGPKDFGKPGIDALCASARHSQVQPCLVEHHNEGTRVLLVLAVTDPIAAGSGNVAWPRQMHLEVVLKPDERAIMLHSRCWVRSTTVCLKQCGCHLKPRGVRPENWELDRRARRAGRALRNSVTAEHNYSLPAVPGKAKAPDNGGF